MVCMPGASPGSYLEKYPYQMIELFWKNLPSFDPGCVIVLKRRKPQEIVTNSLGILLSEQSPLRQQYIDNILYKVCQRRQEIISLISNGSAF
ncbi:hypothetical protein FR483_n673R [Paramecium bursaria Chlorella virus FR483]|uniref:Uncharacterized protein n673R n=1 Tax=Paramecium bursaria Chlorella virus FR483 TaxID=399781 RepID=A7J827_PBCVF|nr:hypothetical protein FR483_n673R [Paramecium bursaria Chlorella virus FR483]ABT15958.1 hypothetical protein FR483_n673R [Paramecium bursaria Chlorella virus FR483]